MSDKERIEQLEQTVNALRKALWGAHMALKDAASDASSLEYSIDDAMYAVRSALEGYTNE